MLFAISIVWIVLNFFTGNSASVSASSDWKYARGWDGIVGSAAGIGHPLDPPIDSLTTRADSTVGGIYICSDANWEGVCGYAVQPLGTCIVLGTDWNDLISSIGPDPGTVVVAYDASNCTGNATAFVYPGTGDLVTPGWNDRISSFEALAQ